MFSAVWSGQQSKKILQKQNVKKCRAISICSDNCKTINNGLYSINEFITLDYQIIKDIIPEEMECYFEKGCITNSWKWHDDNINKKSNLNVIISFFQDRYYYTVMKEGRIIQKRIFDNINKTMENFYEDIIAPIRRIINPDNFVLLASSEDIFKIIEKNISDWSYKTFLNKAEYFENIFEDMRSTNLIAVKQFHTSQGAAIHALYKYFGWTK